MPRPFRSKKRPDTPMSLKHVVFLAASATTIETLLLIGIF